jgi:hypothetical protein
MQIKFIKNCFVLIDIITFFRQGKSSLSDFKSSKDIKEKDFLYSFI